MDFIDWRVPTGIAPSGVRLPVGDGPGKRSRRSQKSPESTDALTVDQAVRLAVANNRDLKIVSLSLDSSEDKVLAAKTRRLPRSTSTLSARNCFSPSAFRFRQDSSAPIRYRSHSRRQHRISPPPANRRPTSSPPLAAAADTRTRSTCTYTARVVGGADRATGTRGANSLGRRRPAGLLLLVEIQNAIAATEASIKQYEELDRITDQYVAEQVVLKSDNLEVKAKLAHEQYKLLQYQDKLQSAKETSTICGARHQHPISCA